MKKQVICLLLIMAVVCLGGCEKTVVSSVENTTSTSQKTQASVSASLETAIEVEEPAASPALLVGEKAVYYIDEETGQIFKTEEEDTKILGAFEDNGTFFVATVTGDLYSYLDNAVVYLYVISDTASIKREVPREYLNAITFETAYNGKAYFEYYDANNELGRDVMVYYDPSTDTFGIDELYTELNGFFAAGGMHYPGYTESAPKMQKDYGFILVEDYNNHEAKIYNEQKECTQAFLLNTDESVIRVGECSFVTKSSETNAYFLYETETNEKTQIFEVDPSEIWTVKSVNIKEAIFEKSVQNATNVILQKDYYRVTFDEPDTKLLVSIPLNGAGAYFNNRLDPKLIYQDDRCYFLQTNKNHTEWYYLTLEDKTPVSLDLEDRYIALMDYGTVTMKTELLIDDESGREYGSYSHEYFEITKDVAWKDNFNELMKNRNESIDEGIDAFKEECEGYRDSSEWDMEYYYPYSTESYIASFDEISDDIIQLTTYYYDYYGGVHGYYGYGYLWYNTAEQKEFIIDDICTLSEEELKDVIARYSVDYWKACGEATPFYVEYVEGDADLESDMYAQFYEYAGFDSEFHFGKDCMYVSYAPYVMGSYAAGYINIPIPYSALGIEF